MEDVFEKKFKEFLPYIIIIAVVYLFAPAVIVISGTENVIFNQIILMGVFPITALACSFVYSYKKKFDFFLSLVAPIIYIPSMFLYGNFRDSATNSIIYLISYFICAYLGLVLGDMASGRSKKTTSDKNKKQKSARADRVASTVDTTSDTQTDEISFDDITPVDKYVDTPQADDFDTEAYSSSTTDDIDAILNEIHNREQK